jgi:hypothetical protein
MNSTQLLPLAKGTGVAEQIRADTGVPAAQALRAAKADPAVSRFVCATLNTAQASPVSEVLGSFVYGRRRLVCHQRTAGVVGRLAAALDHGVTQGRHITSQQHPENAS